MMPGVGQDAVAGGVGVCLSSNQVMVPEPERQEEERYGFQRSTSRIPVTIAALRPR